MNTDSLTCNNCSQNSFITPSAQRIRCHGCKRLLSIGSPSYGVRTAGQSAIAVGQSQLKQSPVSETKSLQTTRCAVLSLELKKKCLYESLKNKFSGCSPQHSQIERYPSIVPTDIPPRGKRALVCGISYKKQKCELKGTARDVKNIKSLLIKEYSFPEESILILAEEGSGIDPTKKNIEDAFKWLVRGIKPGDSLVFYFSGHGKRQRDQIGDEIDGFDETICPVDFKTNGMILDNDINDAIVRPLPKDVTLHAIIDSCHSGTVLDLPHVFDITTGEWEDNRPPSGAYKGTNGGKAICFSACEDYQLAADTSAFSEGKEMTGAMTITFIHAIKAANSKNVNITYQGILEYMHQTLNQADKSGRLSASIRRIFHRRILQDPVLSASEKINTNAEFKL